MDLHLRIIEGIDIPPADPSGKSDSFVIIGIGDTTVKTSVKYQTLQPVWDEKFCIHNCRNGDVLKFTIHDKDVGGSSVIAVRDVPLLSLPIKREPMSLSLDLIIPDNIKRWVEKFDKNLSKAMKEAKPRLILEYLIAPKVDEKSDDLALTDIERSQCMQAYGDYVMARGQISTHTQLLDLLLQLGTTAGLIELKEFVDSCNKKYRSIPFNEFLRLVNQLKEKNYGVPGNKDARHCDSEVVQSWIALGGDRDMKGFIPLSTILDTSKSFDLIFGNRKGNKMYHNGEEAIDFDAFYAIVTANGFDDEDIKAHRVLKELMTMKGRKPWTLKNVVVAKMAAQKFLNLRRKSKPDLSLVVIPVQESEVKLVTKTELPPLLRGKGKKAAAKSVSVSILLNDKETIFNREREEQTLKEIKHENKRAHRKRPLRADGAGEVLPKALQDISDEHNRITFMLKQMKQMQTQQRINIQQMNGGDADLRKKSLPRRLAPLT